MRPRHPDAMTTISGWLSLGAILALPAPRGCGGRAELDDAIRRPPPGHASKDSGRQSTVARRLRERAGQVAPALVAQARSFDGAGVAGLTHDLLEGMSPALPEGWTLGLSVIR